MAKKVESKFLVIEAMASEFLSIGFGGSDNITTSPITSGVLAGFSSIEVAGGGFMVCDDCNQDIDPEDICYYVAVLNRIFCKDCYEKWAAHAKYYPEDAPIEERNYKRTQRELEAEGLWKGVI